MATIAEMLKRWEALDLEDIGGEVVQDTEEELLEANREQMLSGRTSEGTLITPSYSEDPYFNSKEAAMRYAQWKSRISPHPDRPIDTPNLFINGKYHASIDLQVTGDTVNYTTNWGEGIDIENKFKDIRGLSPENTNVYRREYLFPGMVRIIKAKTGAG